MSLILERFAYTPYQTFGRLIFGDGFVYCVERPWDGNMPFKSCIPEGIYTLEKNKSVKYSRDLYEVMGVPNRTRILIHTANRASELAGCIAPGMDLGTLRNRGNDRPEWCVLNSTSAFNRLYPFLDRMENPKIQIVHKIGEGVLR